MISMTVPMSHCQGIIEHTNAQVSCGYTNGQVTCWPLVQPKHRSHNRASDTIKPMTWNTRSMNIVVQWRFYLAKGWSIMGAHNCLSFLKHVIGVVIDLLDNYFP